MNGSTVPASWGPYHKYHQVRDTIIPLVRSKGSPLRTNDVTRPPAVTDRHKSRKITIPWLFSSSSERHVLQCRCQLTPTQSIPYILYGGRGATKRSTLSCPNNHQSLNISHVRASPVRYHWASAEDMYRGVVGRAGIG